MKNNVVFNITVCIIGIVIFAIHAVNILIKKDKRKDERSMFDFIVFTIVHFSTYLASFRSSKWCTRPTPT